MSTTSELKTIGELSVHQEKLERELLNALTFEHSKENLMEIATKLQAYDFGHYGKEFAQIVSYKAKGFDIQNMPPAVVTAMAEFMQKIPWRQSTETAKELIEVSDSIRAFRLLDTHADRLDTGNSKKILGEVIEGAVKITNRSADEVVNISDLMGEYEGKQEEFRKLPKGSLLGIPCGFKKIDDVVDGIRAPHIWIIAAYTSLGKTFFALNILLSVLKEKKKAVLFSLEMSKIDVISRMLGILSETNGTQILKGQDSESIKAAKEFLRAAPLKVMNNKRNLNQIIMAMQEQVIIDKVDLFVVDYIQQIEVDGAGSEYETMREVAMRLQMIAEKLNVPIIMVSQISNEAAKTPNSNVMGFKGAGTIASAADFAIELMSGEQSQDELRSKMMSGTPVAIRAIIKKNRHGRTGVVELEFDSRTGRFNNDSLDNFVKEARQGALIKNEEDE